MGILAKAVSSEIMRVLVAGFGNLLRRDDGFGVLLLKRLQEHADIPRDIRFLEAGIGGISLVQELLTPFDVLVLLDAVEGDTPGEVRVMEVETPDVASLRQAHQDYFSDIHYVEPGRAIALAKGIGVLPPRVYLIGCVAQSSELGEGLSPTLEGAVEDGVDAARRLLDALCQPTETGRKKV